MYQHRFTFLCSKEEKEDLSKLADFHHRSQSDVIRMLLRRAMSDLSKNVLPESQINKGISHEQQTIESQ